MAVSIKERLLEHCWEFVDKKQESLLSRRRLLQDSLYNETKSTAGDKHETARAMVQLEQEKLGQQEKELKQLRETLQKVTIGKPTIKASLGSLVRTDAHSYFLGIFAGRVELPEKVFCISIGSPIGQCLLGKEAKDIAVFNGKKMKILDIE